MICEKVLQRVRYTKTVELTCGSFLIISGKSQRFENLAVFGLSPDVPIYENQAVADRPPRLSETDQDSPNRQVETLPTFLTFPGLFLDGRESFERLVFIPWRNFRESEIRNTGNIAQCGLRQIYPIFRNQAKIQTTLASTSELYYLFRHETTPC